MLDVRASKSPVLEKAWQRFHAMMEAIRVDTEATDRFQDTPQHRAKAYHLLFEIQAMAYNFAIAPRLRDPRVQVLSGWHSDFYTQGQNCPDFLYGVIILDGRQNYRMTGRVGDLAMTLIQVHDGLTGSSGTKQIGNYDLDDFDIAPDGSYEILLGAEQQEGNWIPLDASRGGYQMVFVRRALLDFNGDRGEMRVEFIAPPASDAYDFEEFDEEALAARIDTATGWARYLCDRYNIGLYDRYLKDSGYQKNVMALLPRLTTSQVGSPLSEYAMGIFELADDEGLLVELDAIPDGPYWSFQSGDVWSRSLHFTHRQSSLNNGQLAIDSDGHCRVIVSKRDPGVANWIDTVGRDEGVICFRNYRSHVQPNITARRISLADLDSLLPADTRKVTPEERQETIAYRRAGYRKSLGE